LPRSAAAIVAMLSSLKAGGAYLPLSPDLPAERLRHILHESRMPVIIADPVGARRIGELVSDIDPRPPVITVDPAGRVPRLGATAAPIDRSTPGGLAYIMYTSGTTGAPKGVMVEHHAILRLVINTDFIELGPCDGILQTGSLSFDASTFEVWGALLNGARLVRTTMHGLARAVSPTS
jgi:non-ribosomal peptide synthetase component F